MTTKTRRRPAYGKPPKLHATAIEKVTPTHWVVSHPIAVRRNLPDGGVRVQMEVIERTLDIREVKESDWKLIQPGDKLSLPSRRGPRLWGRAMTPKRKRRHRFTFTFSSMEVRRVQS